MMKITKETQEVIISEIIKNSYMFSLCFKEIDDSYFSDPCCKVIYKTIESYYREYHNLPGPGAFKEVLPKSYYPNVGVSLNEVSQTYDRLFDSVETYDEAYMRDKITKFIREVRSNRIVAQIVNKMSENSELDDETVQGFSKSLEVKLCTTKVFNINVKDDLGIKAIRESAIGSQDCSKVIKSFIGSINQNLMFGGWQPGTVNMIVAPPGCFTGDTRIKSGNAYFTLKYLYDNHMKCEIDGCSEFGEVVKGSYSSIYLSGYVDELVEVTINSKFKIKCTPDHPFMMNYGNYIKAEELKCNDALMSQGKRCRVTNIKKINCKNKVPVYGIVEACPFNNYALYLDEESSVFVSNTGKSMFLVNEGSHAAREGFEVLHIFIGDMVEYDGFIRYLSCISSTPQNQLVMFPIDRQQNTMMSADPAGKIFSKISLVSYPSLSVNVNTLTDDINKFEHTLNKDFDMIIIDYPDNMIQEGRSLYEDGGTLYSSLEKLARMTHAVVLVASQPQKCYWDHSIIPLEAAAESSKKQQCVDTMITFNTEFRGANFGSLLMAKARKGTVGKIFRVMTDYSKCHMEEISESQFQAMKEESKLSRKS